MCGSKLSNDLRDAAEYFVGGFEMRIKVMPLTEQDKKERRTATIKFSFDDAYQNKQSAKKPRIRVQSGQDLTGKVDFSDWEELK